MAGGRLFACLRSLTVLQTLALPFNRSACARAALSSLTASQVDALLLLNPAGGGCFERVGYCGGYRRSASATPRQLQRNVGRHAGGLSASPKAG